MSLYVDTSALLKLYVEEAESDACEAFLAQDDDWVTAAHTLVEVRRNLSRLLNAEALADALLQFTEDWDGIRVIELDLRLCEAAALIAERTGARSLDALHLAAAVQAGQPALVTYDAKLAAAAEEIGLRSRTP